VHYGGVVVNEDVLDCEGGDLCDQDSAEGVGDRGIYANEGEGGIEGFILVELDLKGLSEPFYVPCVVFSWVVACEV